tara:strand:+ start:800 stop:1579 length:780 start_codon:yes stop_codon:yes gene_type:complete
MTIKQQGGIFGRNPKFNEVEVTSLGVGTNAPEADIHVYDSFPEVRLQDSDNTNDFTRFYHSGGNLVFDARNDSSDGQYIFRGYGGGSSSEYLRINTSGNIKFKNSGQGIDFSATSGTGTSELFDDYEEGTWTPVVSDASSGGNTGAGTITGNYTKIGRTVFINFAVSNLNTTGMTSGNDLFITGLPYAVASLAGTNYFTGALVMHSVTTSGNQVAAIQDAQDYIKLYEVVSGSAFDFITVGDINSGVSDIRFSLTYEAA